MLGWREWIALPDLGVDTIKVKIDTGAKTSAIHAFDVRPFERDGEEWVSFCLHPVQRHRLPSVECEARVLEKRHVRSSNGKQEERYVIKTKARIGKKSFAIELTLTNRDEMGFRMLLGREAINRRFLVDPGHSYLLGKGPSS
ncbi:ATP-dependent zinc protease family protein [Sphingomicrobium lutaoense]|uniref:Retropepsin-like aspartic endopeptidase domain-containing protein n=1 Tax=Sphingomicrobium lutaoense TaxID=515949 RepID=A0A839Z549_9SPHN|nr:ATP-dependent zinc protease [Sphingomicrobium lutaoense]MBB3763794.1 hypothetical protein [Sphingomicrobium lutaoense]